jgi:squalene-hopene/tetraprenyl-beta-curcumene cyclase
MNLPYVRRAVDWLKACQNSDGGWGEDCLSYWEPERAGRGDSTPSQTAWAVLGLLAAEEKMSTEIIQGIGYLLAHQESVGSWTENLFTGTGFPQHFYLRYYGYCNYFPLMALGQFRTRMRPGADNGRG